jgi:ATP-dependent helicase Lhr and Lhr-like helicase
VSLLDQPELPFDEPQLLPDRFQRWFAGRGWSPRAHQLALLEKARNDRSALLIAPTGAGKTLAGFLPSLVELSGSTPRARSTLLSPGDAHSSPSPLVGEGRGGG